MFQSVHVLKWFPELGLADKVLQADASSRSCMKVVQEEILDARSCMNGFSKLGHTCDESVDSLHKYLDKIATHAEVSTAGHCGPALVH